MNRLKSISRVLPTWWQCHEHITFQKARTFGSLNDETLAGILFAPKAALTLVKIQCLNGIASSANKHFSCYWSYNVRHRLTEEAIPKAMISNTWLYLSHEPSFYKSFYVFSKIGSPGPERRLLVRSSQSTTRSESFEPSKAPWTFLLQQNSKSYSKCFASFVIKHHLRFAENERVLSFERIHWELSNHFGHVSAIVIQILKFSLRIQLICQLEGESFFLEDRTCGRSYQNLLKPS